MPVGDVAKLLPDDMLYAKEFLTTFPNAPFGLVYFFLDRPLKTEAYIYMGHAYRDAVFNMAINHTVKTPHMVPSGKAIISAWPCYPDSAALATQSDEDMRAFFPDLSGWVEEARVQRHAWGVGRLSPGQHAKILNFKRKVESVRSISFVGNDYDGVHMESGVRGGLRAAERVLKGVA